MSVAVVSVGAKSPVGLNARQTAFLLRSGLPAMAESPLANAAGKPVTMAFVPTLDAALTGPERVAEIARAPLEEALAPIRDLPAEIHIALDEACPDAAYTARVVETMARRIHPDARVRVDPRGEAAPGAMIAQALQSLQTRKADAVVIGGAHSDYDPRAISALESTGRLFSPDNLDARIPGETAAFFVLMRDGDAGRRKLTPLARILGTGEGRERARPDNDAVAYEAAGLTAAVRQATSSIAADGRKAGWLLTDLTFEMWRQYEWQSAWIRSQRVLCDPYHIESPAQRIGALGAAAIPLFVTFCAAAWSHGFAPSPLALALAGNDTGARTALLLGEA